MALIVPDLFQAVCAALVKPDSIQQTHTASNQKNSPASRETERDLEGNGILGAGDLHHANPRNYASEEDESGPDAKEE
jgi:hypothetical protein